jgi:hypothetical protein
MTRMISGLATVLALLAPLEARADFHIRYPTEIDVGELEVEHNGAASFDRKPDKSGAQSYTIEFGTGLTSWWHSEIELGFNRDQGFNQPTLADAIVTENIFMLTKPAESFVDFGFYVEYGQSLTSGRRAGPNEITFGPLIAKDIGPTTTTVNLFLTRELGPDQGTHGLDFSYAAQSRWNLWEPLSPAIEVYGDSGELGRSPRLSRQQLRVGPVGVGSLPLTQLGLRHAGEVKYEIGWLFGATEATAQGTLRWRLELEIPF